MVAGQWFSEQIILQLYHGSQFYSWSNILFKKIKTNKRTFIQKA
jgi:hypothetical protein